METRDINIKRKKDGSTKGKEEIEEQKAKKKRWKHKREERWKRKSKRKDRSLNSVEKDRS